ncbi:MAG: hypothetical protein KBC17_00515 [Candidatus Pacebacteria bacterium]|nr:hypothetical protein [Candidatus Paceibacterota bacterium]
MANLKKFDTLGDVPSDHPMTPVDAFWAVLSFLAIAFIMAVTGTMGNPEDVFRTPGF